MVFFNCNACGEALKKNQVNKHCQRCRRCEVLSCVDCGKDFWGEDYKSHTKCMTEEEKYCGKGFIPKVNKGEAKQEEWIEKVQAAISKVTKNPQVFQLLESLKDYPNIPRKRSKFENFLKNSMRVRNNYLINEAWDLLMTAANEGKEGTKTKATDHHKTDTQNVEEKENKHGLNEEDIDLDSHMSKIEKKESRKKAHKKEKKDKLPKSGHDNEVIKEIKSKKRKHDEFNTQQRTDEAIADVAKLVNKSKKKRSSECQNVNGTIEETFPNVEDAETPKKKRKKVKFNWEKAIITVLKSKGEISLKKLRKKVLTGFAAQHASYYNEENLNAKFEKKVTKIPAVKVFKNRVSLKIK